MSSLSYGPSVGKQINGKDMIQNKNSVKAYRNVFLNMSGTTAANVTCSTKQLSDTLSQAVKLPLHFHFPKSTIIVKFGAYCFQNRLDLSLL